ncbi:MAG TPA: hypothetical protein PKA27_16420 [Fimbriimonadaceae bacterium]|nr:hypothetical protein [Fimbriimonadaceae bacterium]
MHRTQSLAFYAAAATIMVVVGRSATAGAQSGALIRLQQSTPGVAQAGHANLSGTIQAGSFVGSGTNLIGVNAELLDGMDASDFLQDGPNPIILSSATAAGTIQAENTANGGVAIKGTVGTSIGGQSPTGVYGLNTSERGEGLLGVSNHPTGVVYGGRFQTNSPNGIGVYARGDAASGQPIGGYFVSNSPNGTAIYGLASGEEGQASAYFQSYTGIGVTGDSLHGVGVHGESGGTGVRGMSGGSSSSSYGVYGRATHTTAVVEGVYGTSSSSAGIGVKGEVSTSSGANYGGYFKSVSTSGIGAYGEALAGSGGTAGGYFMSMSPAGVGAYGVANGTGTNIGLWGITNAASGWGVYSDGRLGATIKLFCIDHPQDPLNKFLQHYCSEGPEPLNVYTGNVTTDDKGEAWVSLPTYFESINKDFRYTLTVVDDTDSEEFAFAKVARKIREGKFKIRTSVPNIEVTWRVEGVRNDAWVQKHGAPVEVEKPEQYKGKYRHPELYGAPPEMGVHFKKIK